ncbi:MAG: GNAT family N-acetyltransferase [Candidatus Izemoplasmatales bacterium]
MNEVTNNIEKYYHIFNTFEPFNNFVKYAIRDHRPQIFVDDEEHCKCAILYLKPAYFIIGEPRVEYAEGVFNLFHKDSWIIAQSELWKQAIEAYFKDHVATHPRVLFNSSSLNVDHIIKQRKEMPSGLSIVPIEKKHIESGMINHDVIQRFFTKSDFLENGFGFALVGEDGKCEGFSLTNYPVIGKDIELYFRVGYDTYPDYRSKGMGTNLCTYFIEEAFRRGYNPVWDSANDISSHIAKKLGYIAEKEWYMYHIL